MIEINNISFAYGKNRRKKTVVENLAFRASPGECVVLAGPNGAGKSTVLSIAAGILKPDTGTVKKSGPAAYVPQGTALPEDMTVDECLRFFAGLCKCEVPDSLPFSVNEIKKQKISSLSGGMKKQLSIACATLSAPPIILLDEPCAALDMVFRDEMIKTVIEWKKKNKAIVYVGHDPAEFFSFFDTVVFLGKSVSVHKKQDLARGAADLQSFTDFYRSALLS